MKIEINDTGISHGVLRIAEQLPDPSSVKANDSITIKFMGGEFVFLTGLVLLAAWRKALPPGVAVNVDDTVCTYPAQNFLSNTGFREIIDTGHETPSSQRRIGRVPLQPITNQFTKEATVNEIVSIFDEYAGHIDDTNPFKVMISELCENVLAHSEFTSPGYVCARILEKSGKAEITIADTGVGVLQSYLNGTNKSVIERIRKGSSPLDIAIEGLNSSKPQAASGSLRSYYGFGLLITRRLIEENRGQLFLMSGKEALHVDRFHRDRHTLSNPYSGTFIGIVLDLNNPLPLEEIYEKATNEYISQEQGHDSRHQKTIEVATTTQPEGKISKQDSEGPLKKIELADRMVETLEKLTMWQESGKAREDFLRELEKRCYQI